MRARLVVNQGPADLQLAALSTELYTQVIVGFSHASRKKTQNIKEETSKRLKNGTDPNP